VSRRSGAAARRVLGLYDGAPLGDRLHVRLRWWSAPLPAVERHVPRAGRVLEVGCGHGLLSAYLARSSPAREVLGVDIDGRKLAVARTAAARLGPREAEVRFEKVSPDEVRPGPWEAVVFADVLYLLSPARRARLLGAYARALVPGGAMVVKEVDDRPRWKAALVGVQERLATGVLGITAGDELSFPSLAELAATMTLAGLEVTSRRIDRGYPWPHVLVVGRAPVG
jgi:cyclopropane fatty-acyl-phospholipid synthase-like methyltransferase